MIISVDFDGVLVEDKFPDIGRADAEMIDVVKKLTEAPNIEVVLWTSRTAGPLLAAVEWCLERGIHFDAINDNAPSNKIRYEKEFPEGTRKVYADWYVDDHNIGYNREWTILWLRTVLDMSKFVRKG